MAPLESILIKRSILTSNLEQSRCTTKLTLFLVSINRPIKRNLNMWCLAHLNHVGPLNGHLWPLLSLKRVGAIDRLPTCNCLTMQSFKNNTLYLLLQTCSIISLVINSSLNLIFPCNTTHLDSMNQAKSFVSLLCHLASTNINTFQWDSSVPLTLPSKSRKKFYMMLKTPVSTLAILVLSPSLGNIIFYSLNFTSVLSQWFHRQSTQMQMGHSGNVLAWPLAHTHCFEALV